MNPEVWKESITRAVTTLWTKIGEFLPNLIGAILVLVLGYFVSKALQKAGTIILRKVRFDSASEKVGLNDLMAKLGLGLTASEIVGKVIFWLFMLIFIISVAETMGLNEVSLIINAFVLFLPKVIAALLILIIGLALARLVREMVRGTADSIGIDYAKVLSNLVYVVLVVLVATLAVGQLDIDISLVTGIVEIILIAAGAAMALALGLGSRDVAKNIIYGIYLRNLYQSGKEISVGEHKGTLEEIGTVATVVTTKKGVDIIPNSHLFETVVRQEK